MSLKYQIFNKICSKDNIASVQQVINFFSHKLEQRDQSQIGVSQVLATIQQGATQWPYDRLRVVPKKF
ncbi:dymeclin-like [Cephus cinctus]|uniref:Dymeclin-like n=1 Tax=Cephus cinctus TaxID=211228 RepID=A0AAJ7C9Y5_CEPCN|nr:dymeclin-like [Cephus cinctus]